jgi:hypothetical protein
MKAFVNAGEEVRIADDLPLKMIIADGSTVLCDMPDPVARDSATTTLCIRHPSLAAALTCAFEAIWDASPTLAEAFSETQSDSSAESPEGETGTEAESADASEAAAKSGSADVAETESAAAESAETKVAEADSKDMEVLRVEAPEVEVPEARVTDVDAADVAKIGIEAAVVVNGSAAEASQT